MNIFKVVLVLLSGLGFGFGLEKISETNVTVTDQSENEVYEFYGYCHNNNDDEFQFHMLDYLSDEDRALVQNKIDELLISYNITVEDLYNDYEVRNLFMNDLMIFLEENDIDYYGHGRHHDEDDEFQFHMLDYLSDEDRALVQNKIDELLLTYDVTIEELYYNYEVRYNFMNDLMTFLDENEIYYYGHGRHHDEDSDWYNGMGMH